MTPRCRPTAAVDDLDPSVRPGFSLTESLVALLLFATLGALALIGTERSPQSHVHEQAQMLVHALRSSQQRAAMRAEQVRFYVDTTRTSAPEDRYLAAALAAGQDSSDVAPSAWTILPENIAFASGDAVVGPFGQTITTAVPRTEVTCTADGRCDLGGPALIVYYLTSRQRPWWVRAVTLSTAGGVKLYEYDPESATWQ